MDIVDAVTDYLADIKHLGKKSQAGYRQRLTVFACWVKDAEMHLEQVNKRQAQAFLLWLRTSHKPHKAGKEVLSTYFRHFFRVLEHTW
jgi:CRISPR type IV-associated protein Csf3